MVDDDCDDDEFLARNQDESSGSSDSGDCPVDGREQDFALNSDDEAQQMRVAVHRSRETFGGAETSRSRAAGGGHADEGPSGDDTGDKKKTRGPAKADDGQFKRKYADNLPKPVIKGGK